jgi:hypothetical protein
LSAWTRRRLWTTEDEPVRAKSSYRWETFIWGPIALILAALCVTVARSTARDARPPDERMVGRLAP